MSKFDIEIGSPTEQPSTVPVSSPVIQMLPIGASTWVDYTPYIDSVSVAFNRLDDEAVEAAATETNSYTTTLTATEMSKKFARLLRRRYCPLSRRSRRNSRRKEFLKIKRQLQSLDEWRAKYIVLWKDARRAAMRAARSGR